MEAEQAAKQAQLDAERATVKAAEDAAHAEYIRQEVSEFWTEEWMEYIHEQNALEEQKRKAEENSVRPKSVRPEQTVLTKPEEPRLMTHSYKQDSNWTPKRCKSKGCPQEKSNLHKWRPSSLEHM